MPALFARSRRNKAAANRLLRKLISKQMRTLRVMITDKLGSYGAAKREVMPGVEHRQHKGFIIGRRILINPPNDASGS